MLIFLPSHTSVIDIIDYHAELYNINAVPVGNDESFSSSFTSDNESSDKL